MASFLYLFGCITLAAGAALELKTRNRTQRIQLYFTLLGALVFCGTFALLVMVARLNGGQYQPLAATAALLLTAGSLFVVTRTARRFRNLQNTRRTACEIR